MSKRNDERKRELAFIAEGLKKYIKDNNNLPTTSNPDAKSFLPELIFLNNSTPTGGVAIHTLENVGQYFNPNEKDPSGQPYFIGTYDTDQVIIYTNNFETLNAKSEVYFETIKIKSSSEGQVTPE